MCAELGVFSGEFSREIIFRIAPSKMFIVDLFQGIIESGDVNGENFRRLDMGHEFVNLKVEFMNIHNVEVLQFDSVQFLKTRSDDALDFVYTDTNHRYETTVRELEESRRVVKNGGFICGHDYHAGFFPGVVQAVGEFCTRYNLDRELTTDDKLASYKILNVK